MANRKLVLNFSRGIGIELTSVQFCDLSGEKFLTVRGKTAGAYRGAGTFQWTSAVRALCLLVLKTAARSENSFIEGTHASLASSLDYAISKGTTWLCEMFGTTAGGESVAKRLFSRTNPNRKRSGPVIIAFNSCLLEARDISIFIDNRIIREESELLALLSELEPTMVPERFLPRSAMIKVLAA